ncbi:hypothetical protein LEMLEM_LOCUS25002, partial [Lemmus lemmus]
SNGLSQLSHCKKGIQLELQIELGRRSEQLRLLGLILIVCLIICHHLKAISSAPASRVHPEAEALRRNHRVPVLFLLSHVSHFQPCAACSGKKVKFKLVL